VSGREPAGAPDWSAAEIIAVGLYPLAWIGLVWGGAALWARWRR
jgi:hypothetical protein